jgi:hypothetical protein
MNSSVLYTWLCERGVVNPCLDRLVLSHEVDIPLEPVGNDPTVGVNSSVCIDQFIRSGLDSSEASTRIFAVDRSGRCISIFVTSRSIGIGPTVAESSGINADVSFEGYTILYANRYHRGRPSMIRPLPSSTPHQQ